MGGPPAPTGAPPGRPHEASGNVRPRWMATAAFGRYRIRLTGRLPTPFNLFAVCRKFLCRGSANRMKGDLDED